MQHWRFTFILQTLEMQVKLGFFLTPDQLLTDVSDLFYTTNTPHCSHNLWRSALFSGACQIDTSSTFCLNRFYSLFYFTEYTSKKNKGKQVINQFTAQPNNCQAMLRIWRSTLTWSSLGHHVTLSIIFALYIVVCLFIKWYNLVINYPLQPLWLPFVPRYSFYNKMILKMCLFFWVRLLEIQRHHNYYKY